MRQTICRIVGVVLCNNEFSPPADMAVFKVAFLAEYDAIVKRCVSPEFGRFLEMRKTCIYLKRFAATGAGFFLPYEGLVFDILFKFLGTHIYKPRI